jgi:hypothetical protein
MLATAGSLLVSIALLLAIAAIVASAFAFFDLLGRSTLACRVAHVSRTKWLAVLGFAPVVMLIASLEFALHLVNGFGFAILFLAFGTAALIAGLIGGIWYLVAVRRWIAAQIIFARRASELG